MQTYFRSWGVSVHIIFSKLGFELIAFNGLKCGRIVSMRKIVTTTMITLDGVMQAPGGSKEDTAEGFKYGGWQGGYGDEEMDNIFDTKIQNAPFDLLLGRRTYDIFAGYWPSHKDEPRWGKPFDSAKKNV